MEERQDIQGERKLKVCGLGRTTKRTRGKQSQYKESDKTEQLKRRKSDAQRLGNVGSLFHSVGTEPTGHPAEKDVEHGQANLREIGRRRVDSSLLVYLERQRSRKTIITKPCHLGLELVDMVAA